MFESGSFAPRSMSAPPPTGNGGAASSDYHPTAAASGPAAAATESGVRCICPRCRTMLMPPGPLFKCPTCHQTIQVPAAAAAPGLPGGPGTMWEPAAPGSLFGVPSADGFEPQPHVLQPPQAPPSYVVAPGVRAPSGLETRVRSLVMRLPPNHPNRIFLCALLERLPRGPDGNVDQRALSELEHQVNAALRGAPEALIADLPTRAFAKPSATAPAAALDEEHLSCAVCMSAYEGGDVLRALPCLHSFHRDCVDTWLRASKVCPLCKTPIDADVPSIVRQQLVEEAKRSAASAASPPRASR